MPDEELVRRLFSCGVCRFDKYDSRTVIMQISQASLALEQHALVAAVRRMRPELHLALMIDDDVRQPPREMVGEQPPDRVYRELRVDWKACSPRLDRLRARLRKNGAPLVRIDVRACRAKDDIEVATLLDEYIGRSSPTLFFFDGSAFDPTELGHYLIGSDAAGKPFGLCKLVSSGQTLFAEILYGRGSARTNVAFITEGLTLLRDSLGQEFAVIASVNAVTTLLLDIGFTLQRSINVYLLPRTVGEVKPA
jgi:hypothetical protein